MPNGWVHAVIDLIAYGRPYFDLHKEKDKAHEYLGPDHRTVDHYWYQAYGRLWNFHEPFPAWLNESIRISGNAKGAEKAEEKMAWIDHDYIDRVWDNLSLQERKYNEGFFAWILFNPRILKKWARVDVLSGRIQRLIDGHKVWEYCSELKLGYKRLYKYVNTVKNEDNVLLNMIEYYRHGQSKFDTNM